MCIYMYIRMYVCMYVCTYVCICDRICEKVHSSHIQFFNFGVSYNLLWMLDRWETFRDCRTTFSLSLLKISTLYTIHCGFYRSPNTQNQMCEQCTFSQIWSHICICVNHELTKKLKLRRQIARLSRHLRDGGYLHKFSHKNGGCTGVLE